MLVSLPAFGQTIAEGVVGRSMPARLTWAHDRWVADLIEAVLNTRCPLTRTTTRYVSASAAGGGDGTTTATSGATGAWTKAELITYLAGGARTNHCFVILEGVYTANTEIELGADDDNCTIRGTGSINPLLNFYINTLASGGTLWTDSGNGLRFTATVSEVGDIRETLQRKKIYREVASTAAVDSTQNSYYQTGGTIHMHTTGTGTSAVDPDTIAWEYTLASATDYCGIDVVEGCNNYRIDSIDVDGAACDGDGSAGGNQMYGIRVSTTGTDVGVVSNCSCHRNARHNIGRYSADAANDSGGLLLVLGNTYGGVIEANGACGIDYVALGYHEAFWVGNKPDQGSMTHPGTTASTSGIPFLCHTNGGAGQDPGFIYVANTWIPKEPNGWGCFTHSQIANLTTINSPNDTKGLIIGEYLEEAEGTGAHDAFYSYGPETGTVLANSTLLLKPYNSSSIEAICSTAANTHKGYMISDRVRINLNHSGMTETQYGLMNPANSAGAATPRFMGTHFEILANNTTRFAISYDAASVTPLTTQVGYMDGTVFDGSILSVIRPNPYSTTTPAIRTGLRDDATSHINSGFFGDSPAAGVAGRTLGTNCITLTSPPHFDARPTFASPLRGAAGAGLYVDATGWLRSSSANTIGALEYLPPSTYGTTPAELAAATWAASSRTITGGTITTYTGNTPQTGDAYARLGAPAGASMSADVALASASAGTAATQSTSANTNINAALAILGHATNGNAAIKTALDLKANQTSVDTTNSRLTSQRAANLDNLDQPISEVEVPPTVPVSQIVVPRDMTFQLVRGANGLTADRKQITITGEPDLYAVDFAINLPTNGRLADLISVEVIDGDTDGLTFDEDSFAVDKSQAKFKAITVGAGTYTVRVTVEKTAETGGGTASADIVYVLTE